MDQEMGQKIVGLWVQRTVSRREKGPKINWVGYVGTLGAVGIVESLCLLM